MSVDGRHGSAQAGRRGSGHETRAALMRLLEPVVAGAGFDLEDVIVTPAGKRRQVRVIVDADGGISLDGVADVSREISALLDDSDEMGSGPYVLEVTSPGVDRPLTQPRHWRRAVGRLVRATLSEDGEITGRVTSADDTTVVLDGDGQERRLGYDELTRGLVQVEFNRRGDDAAGDED
ncbi:ribosome maturation factor RimP [Actinoallomurus purpureus]|uniref:ribosome maturation factor RimP n=1 Tax=Actinoallomurus purpureus TaxID=478114 RepID=UPI0025B05F4C|nr:ribosome maturation factor RimP [Actinoallomurus purpureus]